jgi:tetratricopeptide (TPR) repeat protein
MLRNNSKVSYLRTTLCALLFVGLLLHVAPNSLAQGSERDSAFQLLQEGKFVEAQEKFEKLAAANPADGQIMFGLGFSILATSKNIKDDAARRQARIRARNMFLKAKELGISNDLLDGALAQLPPDGSEGLTYSKNTEADKAMHEGEAAFTRGEHDKAIIEYERALKLDPKLYEAALFIGDMYFQKKQLDKAGEAYGRAIAINPDRETAYRYWSDVLLKFDKMDEARAKAIEAIVAEPYNRTAYRGLLQWAQANQIRVGHPEIKQPAASMRSSTDKGQTTITVDPKALDPKQGSAYYWSFYDLTRAAYPATFAKDYPSEKAYRHSLKEEASALRVVAEILSKDLKEGKLKAVDDPSLSNLLKLHQADLIEAYVLFVRPDEGIARDYAAYRQTNRDKLRRYWTEFVVKP